MEVVRKSFLGYMECDMGYKKVLGLIAILTIPNHAMAADAAAGKILFEQSCRYCHKSDYDEKFGPGLAGIIERRDVEWLDRFLKNPAEMIKTDEYAQTLHESNDYGLTMPTMPEMQDAKKRQDVIEYMKTLE